MDSINITQIVMIGMVAIVINSVLKNMKSDFKSVMSIAVSVFIFIAIMPIFTSVMGIFLELESYLNNEKLYLEEIFKIIAIAYIAELGCALCLDAGESAIASNIELAGKMMIVSVSTPIVFSLINLVISIMP